MSTPNTESSTHHYALIASAIGGRHIPVHWHENRAFGAYTDNQCIYVPAHESTRSHVCDVIAQALLIRGGSLSSRIVQRLFGSQRTAKRYVFAEIVRSARALDHILPRTFSEHGALQSFPYRTATAEESYQLATSARIFPEFPAFLGSFRGLPILRNALSRDGAEALTRMQQQGKLHFSETPHLNDAESEDAEESKLLKLFETPMFVNRALSNMLRNLLGASHSGKPEANSGAGGGELSVSGIVQSRRKGMLATLADFAKDLVVADQPEDSGSRSYPEWDYSAKRYREHWVLVDELDPWREDAETDAGLQRMLLPVPPLLKRKLAGIGLAFQTHRNQPDGEDYMLDRLIEYRIDVMHGVAPNERIYQRNLKTRRDLAVMILLDVSGSTAERSTEGLSIHERQTRLAWQLMGALHALGDQVALYAYHSWGRTLVRLLRLKSFNEQVIGSKARERFRQLEPAGYTRTGAALRHAANLLKNETRLPYRLLIVLTDGFAYDHDYEGRYAEEDTKKALQEIRESGAGCLCITIGSDQDEAKLRDVFSAAATLAARDYDDFIANIRPALLAAAAQTRADRSFRDNRPPGAR